MRPVVVHVVSTLSPKTDTNLLMHLARQRTRERFDWHIVGLFPTPTPAADRLREQFQALGLTTNQLGLRTLRAWRDVAAVAQLRALFRQLRPRGGVVHTHLLRADLLAGAIARGLGWPVVSTAYAYGEHRRMHYRPAVDPLLDWLCRPTASFRIAVASCIADDLRQRIAWPAERTRVIHSGLDPAALTFADRPTVRGELRRELGLTSDVRLVVNVARLGPEKNHEALIQALAQLPGEVHAVLAGTGPRERELRKLAARCAPGRVHLLGQREDVPRLLAAADVFCMTSWNEGTPMALLEAWAAALPAVVSDRGGFRDLVDDNVSGLRVDPADPGDVAAGLRRILADQVLADRLAAAGRAMVDPGGRLHARTVIQQYEDLYVSMINDPEPHT